jgi:hypothetical protein
MTSPLEVVVVAATVLLVVVVVTGGLLLEHAMAIEAVAMVNH